MRGAHVVINFFVVIAEESSVSAAVGTCVPLQYSVLWSTRNESIRAILGFVVVSGA